MDGIDLMIIIAGVAIVAAVLLGSAWIYRHAARRAEQDEARDAAWLGGGRNDRDGVLGTDDSPPSVYYFHPEVADGWYAHIPPSRRTLTRRGPRVRLVPGGKGSTQQRYFAAQSYYYERGQIDLVNLADGINEASFARFLAQARWFEEETDIPFLPSTRDVMLKSWREYQAQKYAKQLHGKKGYVAIYGNYQVSKDLDGTVVLTAYAGPNREASVAVRCESTRIVGLGPEVMVPGRCLSVTCVGETPGWDDVKRELPLIPVAVYRPARPASSGWL